MNSKLPPEIVSLNLEIENTSFKGKMKDDLYIQRALTILAGRLRKPGTVMGQPQEVKNYLTLKLAEIEHEVFGLLFLDIRNRLIHDNQMFRGSLSHTNIYPREVVKEALRLNAANVVIYHNHPSGDVTPSYADKEVTVALKRSLAIIDVRVVDHIIVAGMETYSFSEKGEI